MIELEKEEKKYYFMKEGTQEGPFPLHQLIEKGVRPTTYVWCDGMKDWEKAEDVADICRLFRNHIHNLMHPGSIAAERRIESENSPRQEIPTGISPTRFDRHLNPGEEIPTIEEIEARHDYNVKPRTLIAPAIIIAVLFSPVIGAVAIYYAVKSRKAWKNGEKEKAHDYCRSAKLWIGLTFFLGLIYWSSIIAFFH